MIISSSGLQLEADHSNVSIPYNKKGNKIHIKKENEGKFTAYCNGKVTNACIQKGKIVMTLRLGKELHLLRIV